MENEIAPVILTDLDDTLFQTMPKCPPGATDLRQLSSLMAGSASGFATKLQQHFLARLEPGLVVPVTPRARKSVVYGTSVSVRVSIGRRRSTKQYNVPPR